MKLFLVRHAKALKRAGWEGSELLRPLTQVGQGQAHAIAAFFQDEPVGRVLSSPHLRCRQTVEPLAAARHLSVELDERLAEGTEVEKALEAIHGLGARPTVVCSHGDVIAAILCELEERGLEIRGRLLCEKGSIWALSRSGERFEQASYVPPARGKTARRLAEKGVAPPPPATEEEPEEARLAVLDLGSTSFHLLVAEVGADGSITKVVSEREMLRLGSVIASDRVIPDDVFRRAVETARALRKTAVKARAEQLFPVATAALRDARNGEDLAREIGRALDNPVRVLSGAEEARIIFSALRRRVSLPPGGALAVDLGGGSLELAVGDAGRVDFEATLPLGVARLYGELVRSDPLAPAEVEAVRARVREALARVKPDLQRFGPRACVATGGTVCALARLVTARRGLRPSSSINELFVPVPELRGLGEELRRLDHAARLRLPAMARHRADLLPVGALVLTALAEALELEGFTVSDWGLREGVIAEFVAATRSRAALEEG